MRPPFRWDPYSDQPVILRDPRLKKQITRLRTPDQIVTVLTSLAVYPFALIAMPLLRPRKPVVPDPSFYALCVNLDKGPRQPELVEELGVTHLQLRVPLWDLERLEEYRRFAESFGKKRHFLITLMQDREHAEDRDLSRRDAARVFEAFEGIADEFQIGNAVNRTKWGFFSMGEYLRWYEAIYRMARRDFPHLKLIGSGVIDFEFHYTIRSLFNFAPIRYDRFGALLYVDRRGSPANTQLGIFDLRRKIDLLYALVRLSPKTLSETIYITETNWPISGTAPWAPTSEKECVDEAHYTRYMREYYEIAARSEKVSRVYWHQLIAPGYGLIDDRNGHLRKRQAFYDFKAMIEEAKRT